MLNSIDSGGKTRDRKPYCTEENREELFSGKICDALNLTRAAIGKIERGEVSPKLETLLAIADFLEVSADWIIRGDESTVISNIPQNLLGLLTKLNQLSEGEQAIAIDTLNTLCDGLIRKRSTA